jgi:hypothetical protein
LKKSRLSSSLQILRKSQRRGTTKKVKRAGKFGGNRARNKSDQIPGYSGQPDNRKALNVFDCLWQEVERKRK